jgi:hypothetical protein
MISVADMEFRAKDRSTVRTGAVSMVMERRQKESELFYDELFALCERHLPECRCNIVLLPECCCDIVLLPECYCVRGEEEQSSGGPLVVFFPSFGMQKIPQRNVTRCRDSHIYLVGTGVIDMSCSLPEEYFAIGCVIDPSGKVIAEATVDQRMLVAELPLDAETCRLQYSVEEKLLSRRRPEAYTALCH